MGNFQGSFSEQTLNAYTETLNRTLIDTYNTALNTCRAENRLYIETCPTAVIENSKIIGGQTAKAQCELTSDLVNQINANFETTIKNATEQFIEQNAKNEQGWIATALSFQLEDARTAQQISNLITNEFQANFTNMCEQEVTAYNDFKMILCGRITETTIEIDQNALAYSLASCVTRNVVDVFTTNSTLNELYQRTEQKLASKQEGISSLFFWLAIAGGIVLLLLVIGLIVFFFLRGSGGEGGDGVTLEVDPEAFEMQPPYYQNMNGALTELSADVA